MLAIILSLSSVLSITLGFIAIIGEILTLELKIQDINAVGIIII